MPSLVLCLVLGGTPMTAAAPALVELFPARPALRLAVGEQPAAERRLVDAPRAQSVCRTSARGPLLLGAAALAAAIGIPVLAYGQHLADRPHANDGMIDPESTPPLFAGAFLTAGAVAMMVTGSIFLMRDERACDPAPPAVP